MAVAIALLSLPLLGSTAFAGEPGVCDTNKGAGKIDSFMQNTEPDGSGEWMNGNMNGTKADFKEGDWIPQRVQMSALRPGENELAFEYTVWLKNKGDIAWAFDDVRFKSLDGATVTRWYVESPGGPTATVYVTFDVPVGTTTATLYYDLHIASELDHGAGTGAGSIDGSPYHGGLLSLNCAKSGQNANQIMASAIQAGLLTVVKNATPADGTDFHFSITPGGDASTFYLDDDSDATLPDRVTYRVPPGTFTVEEIDIPSGWNLTGLACSKTPSASTPTSGTVSIADDESVTCTFTNDKISRKDLGVTATATPSYARDYDWSVDKSVVGAATQKIAEGQSASFDYSVVVTPSAPQDSKFEVSGKISVTNPNPIAVEGVTITDSIPGATCTVSGDGGTVTGPVTIPSGGKDFTYRCTLGSDTTAGSVGTNTVNLDWSAADYFGTTGSATGTAGFDFGTAQPTVTDDAVTVTDSNYDLAGSSASNVVRATGGPRTFTYSLTWPGEPGICKTYENTATITEADGGTSSDAARAEVCEGKDLTVEKTVVSDYYRTYAWSLSKDVVGPARKDVDGNGTATFDYRVTATAGPAKDSNWGMSGKITVSNPNAWPVTLSDIADQVDVGGGAACVVDKGADLVVDADSARVFSYTCTFGSQPSYDGMNTATVTWDGTKYVSPHTSATGKAAVVAANWKETSVDKTVTVYDDKTDPANPVELGTATWAGEGTTQTFSYTGPALAGKKGECVDYTNHAWIKEVTGATASAKATVCWPVDLTVSKTASGSYDTTYFWTVSKQVDKTNAEVATGGTAPFTYTVVAKPNGSEDSSWALSGVITVSNPNTFKAVTVSLSDVYDGGGVCTPDSTSVQVPAATKSGSTITPGRATVAYSCAFNDQPSYTGTNTVTASWDGGQATGTAKVGFVQAGKHDYDVDVLDDRTDPDGTAAVLGHVTWDDPLDKRTFTYTLDLGAQPGQCVDYTNTARVDVSSGDVALLPQLVVGGVDPSAQQTVEVCEKAALVVSKDVTATYDTQYFWDITKRVDRTDAEVGSGGTAPFGYTVVAKPNGSRDSGWKMSGTITVTNPNTYESATVSLTDVYDGGGVCTPESGTVEVPKDGTVEVPYTCAFTGQPSYTGTNTVTASWDGQAVKATAPVTFTRAGRTDYQVQVKDDLAQPGSAPKVLGTAAWGDPLEKRTFTYTLERGAQPGQCAEYTNTAWVTVQGTDPTARATVRVCEKAALGVTKDVTASYDTRYYWDVSKDVDKTSAEVGPGGTAPFTYTVVAKPNGSEDSGWTMSGTITVTNPNVYRSATVKLTDTYDGGGVCTPDSGTVVVPAASVTGSTITPGRVDVGYHCTFSGQPAYTGVNTATAAWDGVDYTGTAPVRFAQAGTTDYRVDVFDDLTQPNADPKLLGTVAWDDPVEKRTFTNTLQLGAKAGQCVDHTNTAWVEVKGTNPSARKTVSVCEDAKLMLSKDVTATYDRHYLWDVSKDVDRRSAEVGPDGTAPFDYTVVAKPNGFEDSNWQMSGTITLTNPNAFKPASVTLTDVYDGGGVCTPESETVEVPKGGTVAVPYTCAFTEKPAYKGTNTVTATWNGEPVTATAAVSFQTGQKTDEQVDVYDDLTNPNGEAKLLGTVRWGDPLEERTFTNTLHLGGRPGECVARTNTAWVAVEGDDETAQQTVKVCEEAALQISEQGHASFDRTYHWLLDKSVDQRRVEVAGNGDATFRYTVKATPNGYTDSAYDMGGTITVTNPNDYTEGAITATVTDVPSVGEGAACVVAGGDKVLLEPGETKELSYTCSFGSPPDQSGTNTATATWTGPDAQHSVSTGDQPVTFEATGLENHTVTVTDSMTTPPVLGTATWNADGKATEFPYTLTHEGTANTCVDHTNKATLVETGQSDSETVTVCGRGGLVVTNTADASYDRTYQWDISKAADQDRVVTTEGEPATVGYTVGVTPTGFTDSGWELKGALTVLNPNDFEDVTLGLTDVPDLGEGASCAFDETAGLVVRAGETRTFGYSCTFEQQPSYDGSNTVVVDWGAGRVTATAAVAFDVDQEVDKTITVTDDHVDPAELGTVTWDENGETTEFDYTLDLEGPVGRCATVTNTAAIVETGQEAQADVVVCGHEQVVPPPHATKPPHKTTPPHKGRPPLEILPAEKELPQTGAPSNTGLWTTIGGLMVTLGAALLIRRRRQQS